MTCTTLAAVIAHAPPAAGAEVPVGPGGHATIQAAIRSASPGDVIVIAPGTYLENVVVDRAVTLRGMPGAVVDGGTEGDVITIKADGAAVEGLVVRGGGRRQWRDESAIKILSDGNRIENNVLEGVLFGVHVWGGSRNVIRGNRITGLAHLIEHDRGDGIRLYDSSYDVVEDNHIVTPRDGIYVEFASHNRIAGNRVEGARIGLHYMFANDNVFEDNVFFRNGVAAAVMYSKRLVVRRNVFSESYGYGAYGLFLKDAESALVEGNLVLANETGLSLDFSMRCSFKGNYVAANEVAVRVLASSQGNLFSDNTFMANGDGVYLSPGRHVQFWDDNAGRGNYWSGYRGYDLDGDGVGDIASDASEVFGYLVESYPELKVMSQSPAAQAIMLAEQAFPVLERPRALDRYPLMQPAPLPGELLRRLPEGRSRVSTCWWAMVLSAGSFVGAGALWKGGQRRR